MSLFDCEKINIIERFLMLSEMERHFLELEKKYRNKNIIFLIDVDLYVEYNNVYFDDTEQGINDYKFYLNGNDIIISCEDEKTRKYNILIDDYGLKECDYKQYIRVLEIKEETEVKIY